MQLLSIAACVAGAYAYDVVSDVSPRCAAPAVAGSHVIYDAVFSHSTGETRELNRLKVLHAVVGAEAIGNELEGVCVGDVRKLGGHDDHFPEEFRHMSHWKGAHVNVRVTGVTSENDYRLIDVLRNRDGEDWQHIAANLINEDRTGINAFDPDGATSLMIAINLKQQVLTASLLNAYSPRCDVNVATPSGYTALIYAVGQEDKSIVKALLRRGANPNAQIKQADSGGWSALHFACRFGNLDIVQALLDFDADPMLTGFAGETAFKVAEDAAVSYSTRKKLAAMMNKALEKKQPASSAHAGEL